MKKISVVILALLTMIFIYACGNNKITNNPQALTGSTVTSGYNVDTLPPPYATKSATNFSKVVGWSDGKTPVAPRGFTVTKFAD
ncbi:MAG TPA: hypothetical protein VFN95_03515, partial [Flavitalea sp.]|nr:hypothetical protein [Flavitalea sp.]